MLLQNKITHTFAGDGALTPAATAGFQRAGALTTASGRDVDVLDEAAIDAALRSTWTAHGGLDVVFNGVGPQAFQAGSGPPATVLDPNTFSDTLRLIVVGQFLTARCAARLWQEKGKPGTIIMLTSSLSRLKAPRMTSISTASAAIEGLSRSLAAEFGADGIRVVCVNGTAFSETKTIQDTSRLQAEAVGVPPEAVLQGMRQGYSLGRPPTVAEFGDLVAFLASDHGAILNSHVVDADRGTLNVI